MIRPGAQKRSLSSLLGFFVFSKFIKYFATLSNSSYVFADIINISFSIMDNILTFSYSFLASYEHISRQNFFGDDQGN